MSDINAGVEADQPACGTTRRRLLLRGTAALAGVTAASGAFTGFPTIWAQNIKDVVLRQAGSPVAAIPKIADQANKDLGFTISMQATENRIVHSLYDWSDDMEFMEIIMPGDFATTEITPPALAAAAPPAAGR
jgi:hypothetical protein